LDTGKVTGSRISLRDSGMTKGNQFYSGAAVVKSQGMDARSVGRDLVVNVPAGSLIEAAIRDDRNHKL
ncbi:MAG TPA: hypothetical protein VJQ42_03080, partial [Rhodanobacteraceae bacterium]|nr:hypothetical protein [Rhodanobacteraceae bacterium]